MGAVRVVVVDDSGFFRRRIVEMLNADATIEVVGTATNGAEGVQKVVELKPDVVTMDIEMPVMDGISAVKQIMSKQPTPVLMFSSLTHEGAQATLDALEAGALDFLPKSFEDISKNRDEVQRLLCRRVSTMARRATRRARPASTEASTRAAAAPVVSSDASWRVRDFSLVTIGASTGGPVALQKVLTKLPANFPLPLLLIQHMPASFTPAFAQRLNQQCAITVKEASDGDPVEAGVALLAPGGKQMVVESVAGRARVKIQESPPGQHYNPCVDTTFESAAKAFPGKVLAIILTGMGADGREGARMLKKGGATIWAQDEASSVIYGMPAAVVEAGLAHKILPLDRIGSGLAGGA